MYSLAGDLLAALVYSLAIDLLAALVYSLAASERAARLVYYSIAAANNGCKENRSTGKVRDGMQG